MATTSQAERDQHEALLAEEYLNDLVYNALLERGEAAKVSEITLEIDNPRITVAVVRRVLNDSARFLLVGRLWDIAARFLDRSRPTERNLAEVLHSAGRPLSVAQMATELSIVYDRPSDVYLQMLARMMRNESLYFKTTGNEYGPVDWLPVTGGEDEDAVFADNGLRRAPLVNLIDASRRVNWGPTRYAEATFRLIEAVKRPLPHRLLGVLAWLVLQEKYDSRAHLSACLSDSRLVWLSGKKGGRWITRSHADRLELLLEARGVALSAEDAREDARAAEPTPVARPVELPVTSVEPDEPEAAPITPEPEMTAPEPEPVAEDKPLDITEEDLAALSQILVGRETPIETGELLALRFEIVPGDPSFRADVETLEARLKEDERFLYVGAGRFREPDSLPPFVYSVPEFLQFPELQFVSMDGEIMDEEIEDEGFAGSLRHDILAPLAQDAGDEEGRYTGTESPEAETLRLVVKAHHKEIGTFPLCQVPEGFFPTDAPVIEITLRDSNGETHNVIVNNEQRLCFNLFGLYENLNADSGAAFLLHRTGRPYEYRFEPTENDAQVYVPSTRLTELLALREQSEESGDMATFDIACEVLAHYPKGLDFVQAMTEINIVRRVTRRKLASILSFYQCFVQRPGQPQWKFDAKKRDLGTDRAKRKYIKR
ncbi:MAG: hypothetical protein SFU56_07795 [Capsulimonadales bacterium]|nr:hypothetical protein [Capsulimonadales bacterium]